MTLKRLETRDTRITDAALLDAHVGESRERRLVGDRPGDGLAEPIDLLLGGTLEGAQRGPAAGDELVDVRRLFRRDRSRCHPDTPRSRPVVAVRAAIGVPLSCTAADIRNQLDRDVASDRVSTDSGDSALDTLAGAATVRLWDKVPVCGTTEATMRPWERRAGPIDDGRRSRTMSRASSRIAAWRSCSGSAATPTSRCWRRSSGAARPRFVTTRHEQVAAHAADGYARASGRPGVVLLHVGPGMTNAVTGVATASFDSVPLLVIAGDVPSYYEGRGPHQEFNLRRDADQVSVYEPFVKRAWRVRRADQVPRIAGPCLGHRARRTAWPGPRLGAHGHPRRGPRR